MNRSMRKLLSEESMQIVDLLEYDSSIDSSMTTRKPVKASTNPQMDAQHGVIGVYSPPLTTTRWSSPIRASSSRARSQIEPGSDCTTGKAVHASPQAAWSTLTAVVKHRHRKPKFWHRGKPGVYQCPFCHGWHTTSAHRGEAA